MRHGFRGMEFYLSSTNGLILRRGAVPMVTHTDQLYIPYQTAMPLVMTVMVCLSDFTEEMGATRVVPRSHLRPPPGIEVNYEKMDAINPDQIETVPAECEAGSAIVFEGRLWHRSGAHRSDRTRYSVSTYYGMPFCGRRTTTPPACTTMCTIRYLTVSERCSDSNLPPWDASIRVSPTIAATSRSNSRTFRNCARPHRTTRTLRMAAGSGR